MIEFEVTRFHIQEPEGSYDMLEVRCPRASCRGRFWVPLGWATLTPPAKGRNCAMCGFASAITGQPVEAPGDRDETPDEYIERRRTETKKPRMVVRGSRKGKH